MSSLHHDETNASFQTSSRSQACCRASSSRSELVPWALLRDTGCACLMCGLCCRCGLESCFGGGLGAPEGGGVLEFLGNGGRWGERQVCFVAFFEES
jgi:hypothetical protein